MFRQWDFKESSSFLLRDSDQIIALKVSVCPFKFMMINKLEHRSISDGKRTY